MPDGNGPEMPEGPETPDNPPAPDDVTRRIPRTDPISRLRAQGIEVYELAVVSEPSKLTPAGDSVVVESEAIEIAEPALIEASEEITVSEAPVGAIEAPVEIIQAPSIEAETAAAKAAPAEEYEADEDSVVELAAPPMLPVAKIAAPVAKPARLAPPVAAKVDQPVSFQKPQPKLEPPRSMVRQAAPRRAAQQQKPAPQAARPAPVTSGEVAYVDARNGTIHLKFPRNAVMPVGTKMTVFHEYFTGRSALGEIQVVQSSQGAAIARPVGLAKVWKIARGDEAVMNR